MSDIDCSEHPQGNLNIFGDSCGGAPFLKVLQHFTVMMMIRSSRNKDWNEEEISRQRSAKFHRMTYVV